MRDGLHPVAFDEHDRWSMRLHASEYADVWLIGWTREQSTELHDHAGSLGALTVVTGSLEEQRWAGAIGGRGPRLANRSLKSGRGVSFPVGHVHDVANRGAAAAISVHAYSPPLTAMSYYRVDGSGSLRRTRSVLTDDPEPTAPTVHRVDAVLEGIRAQLDRVTPGQAAAAVTAGALLVDSRPVGDRERYGVIPGAAIIDRNVLEWRLDPTSPTRIAEANSLDRQIIVFCNDGYASSLAAVSLQTLGLHRATDLIGGFNAWAAAGLPTAPASLVR